MSLETMAKAVASEVKGAVSDVSKKVGEFTENRVDSDKRINPVEKTNPNTYDGLSNMEKLMGKVMGYPDSILNSVYSFKELNHYHDLGLVAKPFAETAGGQQRYVLVPKHLDMKSSDDQFGRSNIERAQLGLPLLKEGKPLEYHHIGQKDGGDYALLTKAEHVQNGNKTLLHYLSKEGIDHGNVYRQDIKSILKSISEGV